MKIRIENKTGNGWDTKVYNNETGELLGDNITQLTIKPRDQIVAEVMMVIEHIDVVGEAVIFYTHTCPRCGYEEKIRGCDYA